MKQLHSILICLGLLLGTTSVSFATTAPDAEQAPQAVTDDWMPCGSDNDCATLVDQIHAGMNGMITGARDMVSHGYDQLKQQLGVTDEQVLGVVSGAVTGAVIADLLGSGGMLTLATSAGGAALGGWAMTEPETDPKP